MVCCGLDSYKEHSGEEPSHACKADAEDVQDVDEFVASLLPKLTLEEKVDVMTGHDMWRNRPLPQHGLRSLRMTDGPHGARGGELGCEDGSASFPCEAALGATFDEDLIFRIGQQLGSEATRKGCNILLAPTVNLQRVPNSGRHFECFSEDPHLTSRCSVAYVRGVQSRGVGCVVKHFAGNDQELNRTLASSEISERALRELYLPPFEAAVKEAQVAGVMTGYNKLGGVYCASSEWLLTRLLRDEWAFRGFVVSDWYGNRATAESCRAGLNLEMPGMQPQFYGALLAAAARDGQVSEVDIDRACAPMLAAMARFASTSKQLPSPPGPLSDEVRVLCREAVAASCVLLKNDGPAALPFDLRSAALGTAFEAGRRPALAVLGSSARETATQGGGSARVVPAGEGHASILDCLSCACKARGADVVFEVGDVWNPPADGPHLLGMDRAGRRRERSKFLLRVADSAVSIFGLFSQSKMLGPMIRPISSRVRDWLTQEVQNPIAETLGANDAEMARVRAAVRTPAIERAALAARNADFAVVVVGTDGFLETEGEDMRDIMLPGYQDALVAAVAEAREGLGNWAVVLNCGSPKDISAWIDKAPCVLACWFGGQELGPAVTDVLLGVAEPGGRLPQEWPRSYGDCSVARAQNGATGKAPTVIRYNEGLMLGYRSRGGDSPPPRFPFGFGLSYSGAFEYTNFSAHFDLAEPDHPRLEVSVDVALRALAHTGSTRPPGQEVVQLYLRVPSCGEGLRLICGVLRGFRKLGGFEAGAAPQRATFRLGGRDLSCWSKDSEGDAGHWAVTSGELEVSVGASSCDLRCKALLALLPEVAAAAEREANGNACDRGETLRNGSQQM